MNSVDKQKRLHFDVTNVGLRAQATAVGLVQLCIELHNANILSDLALQRIKDAIADEVSIAAPRRTAIQNFRREIRERHEPRKAFRIISKFIEIPKTNPTCIWGHDSKSK